MTLRISDLEADADLVELAHSDARSIVDDDPTLERPENHALALETRDRFGAYFEELERP